MESNVSNKFDRISFFIKNLQTSTETVIFQHKGIQDRMKMFRSFGVSDMQLNLVKALVFYYIFYICCK